MASAKQLELRDLSQGWQMFCIDINRKCPIYFDLRSDLPYGFEFQHLNPDGTFVVHRTRYNAYDDCGIYERVPCTLTILSFDGDEIHSTIQMEDGSVHPFHTLSIDNNYVPPHPIKAKLRQGVKLYCHIIDRKCPIHFDFRSDLPYGIEFLRWVSDDTFIVFRTRFNAYDFKPEIYERVPCRLTITAYDGNNIHTTIKMEDGTVHPFHVLCVE
jgi:hypothetical protein